MSIKSGNLFTDLPGAPDVVKGAGNAERFASLIPRDGLRLVRIVSTGQTTPPGAWYDQDEDEWVVVLAGDARLSFADETLDHNSQDRTLSPGDWLLIPAHCRHRVAWTDPGTPTVWLALHADLGG